MYTTSTHMQAVHIMTSRIRCQEGGRGGRGKRERGEERREGRGRRERAERRRGGRGGRGRGGRGEEGGKGEMKGCSKTHGWSRGSIVGQESWQKRTLNLLVILLASLAILNSLADASNLILASLHMLNTGAATTEY